MREQSEERVWIIQRCIDALTNHYENWPEYSEKFMTRSDMVLALEDCGIKWPNYSFRGHNIHSSVKGHQLGEFPRSISRVNTECNQSIIESRNATR